jgi:hypothetical protein
MPSTKFDPYPFEGNAKRSGASRRRDMRYILPVGLIFAAGLAISAWALTVATSRHPSESATSRYETTGFDDRTGNILDPITGRCRSFDNDTGRVVESVQSESCDALLNRRELTGTARRLDAISKSFLNR